MTELFQASTGPRDRQRFSEHSTLAACSAFVLLLIAWLDPGLPWPPSEWTFEGADRLLLNAAPALLLLLALWGVTRRLLLACWLVLLALWALYAVNAAKLAHLETPLLPADFRLLADPGPSFDLLSHYLHFTAGAFAAIAVATGVTLVLFFRPLPALVGARKRLALFGGALLLVASLVAGAPPWRSLYDPARLGFEPWSISGSAARAGLIGTLLLYQWDFGARDVPPADRDTALRLLRDHIPVLQPQRTAPGSSGALPDIVVIQSESLFDPSRLHGLASGRYLHAFDRLAAQSRSGELVVPTFGGGTIRTEFEVLTGAPLAALGGMQYPWIELDRRPIPAVPGILAQHGYRTLAIHPNSGAFWNRARAYPALGFERFVDGAAFPESTIVGLFPGDGALTDRVLDELSDEGPPQFIFAVSMEAHGPFDWRPGLDAERLAALPVPEALDDGGRYWLRNYLYLIEDADRELGRLADALQKRGRRTLLLFYGDHLPALPPVYAQLGFDDGRAAEHQPVPWLLLDTAAPNRHRLDTQSWLLPTLLLHVAGIDDSPYFSLVNALRPELDLDDWQSPLDEPDGVVALARLHLRDELAPLLHEVLGAAAD